MRLLLLILAALTTFGCDKPRQPVRIATNPWPGYELLHLAEQMGYFEEAKLNVKLVQINSLADSLRAYQGGRVDGFTSTLVEVVQSQLQHAPPLKTVLVADYSNGGDLIVTRKVNATVEALKSKKIGCEVSALGIVVLAKALALHGMSITDVTLVNLEQLSGEAALQKGEIDAFVTYPPVSVNLLAQSDYHSVFSSREIPGGILDVVTVSAEQLKAQPDFPQKLQQVWQRAYSYIQEHPQDAFARMAKRENISAEEFAAIYEQDIHVYSLPEMLQRLHIPKWLDQEAQSVCDLLRTLDPSLPPCDQLPSIQL